MSAPVNLERCPHCGARNSRNSRWCSQCLTRLDEVPPPAPPSAEPSAAAASDGSTAPFVEPSGSLGGALVSAALEGTPVVPGGTTGLGAALASAAGATVAGATAAPPATGPAPTAGLRAGADPTPERLRSAHWTCTRCGADNTYADEHCVDCGASVFSPLAQRRQTMRSVPPSTVLTASLVPGGGFFALGVAGQGTARLLMTLWALAIGIVLGTSGTLLALKIVFLLAAAGLWALSAIDALALQRGSAVLLSNKVIVIVMSVLLGILFLGLVTSTRPAPTDRDGGLIIQEPPAATGR